MRKILALLGLSALAMPWGSVAHDHGDALSAAVDGAHRTPSYSARDRYRNPYETLQFFGLQPDMTVVELSPGGGWYTEILAPHLKDKGKLYAAHFNPDSPVEYYQRSLAAFKAKLKARPDLYSAVELTVFDPPTNMDVAPAGSADAVLTFRNLHNWYMRGAGEARLSAALQGIYRALKPGGVFGVVEHRLPAHRPLSDQDASGYMREDFVIEMAQKAGFRLLKRSEINANPLDTADHPKGVWSLPPSLRMGEVDAERYLSIGESDRMTLLFEKP